MSGKMPVSWGVPAFCEYICPVGTLEGGIPLLSTHPELRRVIGTLFSVKMVILVITHNARNNNFTVSDSSV